MSAQMFVWDWKAQPPMDNIAVAVEDYSGGKVYLRRYITGTDSFAWIVSDHPVSDTEARKLYQS